MIIRILLFIQNQQLSKEDKYTQEWYKSHKQSHPCYYLFIIWEINLSKSYLSKPKWEIESS